MVEVLIGGAGPAGATAAILLARRAVRVLIVDDRAGASPRPAGALLTPDAVRLLDELDLAGALAADARTLRGLTLHVGRARVTADFARGDQAWVLPRPRLDEALLEAASAAGAQVREGARVAAPLADGAAVRGAVLEDRGRRLRLPAMVTIASGAWASSMAASTGTGRPACPTVTVVLDGVTGTGPRHELHLGAHAACALTPLGEGLACLQVTADIAVADGDALRALAKALPAGDPLAARCAAARPVGQAIAIAAPANAMATGDAGGLLVTGDTSWPDDAVAAEGLAAALIDGVLVAEVALALLERPGLNGPAELARRRAERLRPFRRRHEVLRLAMARAGARLALGAAIRAWPRGVAAWLTAGDPARHARAAAHAPETKHAA